MVQTGKGVALEAPNSPPVLTRGHRGARVRLLTVVRGRLLRDNKHKLQQKRFRLGVRSKFLS